MINIMGRFAIPKPIQIDYAIKMTTFGLVGLETSHPVVWADALSEMGHAVAIYDDGSTTPTATVDAFCKKYSAQRYDSLQQLIDKADIIAAMQANFDQHVPVAEQALRYGRTVYLDKPIACNDADLEKILRWQDRPLILGSSNRLDPRLLALRKQTKSTPPHFVHSTIGSDEFFSYASHGVEIGQTVLGVGATAVRAIHDQPPLTFQIAHHSGALWLLQICNPSRLFEVTVQLADQRLSHTIPGGTFHRTMIEEILKVHHGSRPLIDAREAVEAIRILRAAHTSLQNDGQWVGLDQSLVTFSGSAYAREYRQRLLNN